MELINHYSAYTPARTSAASQTGTKIPGVRCVSCDEFAELAKELGTKPVDQSQFLYNGSETRAKLSDTEIAVLANKYDVRNMSDTEYDSFLDDLESMGAISHYEKTCELGYKNLASFDANELHMWTSPLQGNGGLLFNRTEANGDVFRWLNDRTQWERSVWSSNPAKKQEQKDCEDLYKALAGIVGRMAVQRDNNAETERKTELVRQLADGNSAFYTNMRNTLKAQVEKSKEDQEEDDIIEALGKVLDALSEKKDVSGKKSSLTKSAGELTGKIGERIARLRREDPHNPEITKLENMLKRFQEMGIYIDLDDMDDLWPDEDETFETLTQLLTRRQAEEINSTVHPNQNEVNKPA